MSSGEKGSVTDNDHLDGSISDPADLIIKRSQSIEADHTPSQKLLPVSYMVKEPIKINHEALIIRHGRVGPNHTVVNGHARIQLRSLGFMQAG
jgi:hypothetical protein